MCLDRGRRDETNGTACCEPQPPLLRYMALGLATLWLAALGCASARSGDGESERRPERGIVPDVAIRLGSQVYALAVAPDGTWLATASREDGIVVWELPTGKRGRVLGAKAAVPIALAAHGERLVAGCGDGTVRVWNVRRGLLELTLRGHTREVESVAISPQGQWLASAAFDGSVRVWDLRDGSLRSRFALGRFSNTLVAWGPRGRSLVVAHGPDPIRVYDLSGRLIRTLPQAVWGGYSVLATSGDGNWGVAADYYSAINSFDLVTGELLARWIAHVEEIHAIDVDPHRRRLVSGCWGSWIRLWEAENKSLVWETHVDEGEITATVFGPTGRYVVAASVTGAVMVLDASTGRKVGE